jgi:hypothetical protein
MSNNIDLHYGRFLDKINRCINHIDKFRILGNASYRNENLDITEFLLLY